MSNLKKLEEEFIEKEVLSSITNLEEANCYINSMIDESEELKLEILKLIKEGCIVIFKEKLLSLFSSLTGRVFGFEYAEEEKDILDKELDLCLEFIGYQNRLLGIVNEDNYGDVTKLSNMTYTYLLLNYYGYEERIEINAYASNGIIYSSNKNEGVSNRYIYRDFFNQKVEQMQPKVLKKV